MCYCKSVILYCYPILLQETQAPLDLYAMVICVELAQSKQASEPPLLGKNTPKDHDGIFSPVSLTSIPVPPIDINLTLFPSGNCVMFSVFRDNELPFSEVTRQKKMQQTLSSKR